MDLGKVIYNVLSNDVNVISLVGLNEAGDGRRIFPIQASYKETLPLIIYRVINADPEDDKDGVSTLDQVEFEASIYTSSYSQLVQLSDYVRTALDGYSATNNGVVVDRIAFESFDETFDTENNTPVIIQDYRARIKR